MGKWETIKAKTKFEPKGNELVFSLEKLSEKTGISTSALSRYQDNDHVPYVAMQKIADALNLPVSALMSEREIPEDDKLTYDQVNLQLQATQQHNVYLATLCDGQNKNIKSLRTIAIILVVFLVYVIVDRFFFPGAGIFRGW